MAHWCWIDQFIEFRSGRRAKAVKNISLAENLLRGHFSLRPVMPGSLIIEGMGQTGMLLACEALGYAEGVYLAKVPSARFFRVALPGDTLTYSVTLESINEAGVSVAAESRLCNDLQGQAELLYARLPERADDNHAEVRALVKMMELLGVFRVGMDPDGKPLNRPIIP
jgi:3-hydroxyacyl-[acyl-carrier-protein] dehydratase